MRVFWALGGVSLMSTVMEPDALGGKGYFTWCRSRSACLSSDAERGRQTRPDHGARRSVMQAAGKVGMQFASGARRREAKPASRRDPQLGSGVGGAGLEPAAVCFGAPMSGDREREASSRKRLLTRSQRDAHECVGGIEVVWASARPHPAADVGRTDIRWPLASRPAQRRRIRAIARRSP